jgi:hypothetical protein
MSENETWMHGRLRPFGWRNWLPTPGNILFTLLMMVALFYAIRSGLVVAAERPETPSSSTDTIAYQGRLADANGNPLTGTYNMVFKLYDVAAGGSALWTETWSGGNAIQVNNGLFNVLLGSITPVPAPVIEDNTTLWLGVKVGTDAEMTPRVQIGSVPYAIQSLVVPDASITTEKIADGAVTLDKLAPSIFTDQVYTLTLSSWVQTQSDTSAAFGAIDLPQQSNLYISSMWNLQNNDTEFGMRAWLEMDGTAYTVYADVIALSDNGWGYTVARNHMIPNVASGNHTFSVHIDQFPGQSGMTVGIGPGSVMWIRAVPTGP